MTLIPDGGIVRRAGLRLVDGGRVFGLIVYGPAFIVIYQRFLDFPIVLLDTDREFKVLAGDGVPVLLIDTLAK
jgi:hypothetical protein